MLNNEFRRVDIRPEEFDVSEKLKIMSEKKDINRIIPEDVREKGTGKP
jgi:hypothetical protein